VFLSSTSRLSAVYPSRPPAKQKEGEQALSVSTEKREWKAVANLGLEIKNQGIRQGHFWQEEKNEYTY
jgi:hypothetical protein